jgi:hypothetical protein
MTDSSIQPMNKNEQNHPSYEWNSNEKNHPSHEWTYENDKTIQPINHTAKILGVFQWNKLAFLKKIYW